jgi:hypothetical protein
MAMTVRELADKLTAMMSDGVPEDAVVVMDSDPEGNDVHPADGASVCLYAVEGGERSTFMTEEERLSQRFPEEWDPAPEDAVVAVSLSAGY